MCRVVDTVLVNQETVYSPRQSNDRLLLGLKGSLNEYELDLFRQRSLEARREKAKRGELIVAAPVTAGDVAEVMRKQATGSNIHCGTSSKRAVSNGSSAQRKTVSVFFLSTVVKIHTVRPHHGCQRQRTSFDSLI
ncbi:hypothetical protein VSR69_45590 [Paraburkholderia phytofirmans]